MEQITRHVLLFKGIISWPGPKSQKFLQSQLSECFFLFASEKSQSQPSTLILQWFEPRKTGCIPVAAFCDSWHLLTKEVAASSAACNYGSKSSGFRGNGKCLTKWGVIADKYRKLPIEKQVSSCENRLCNGQFSSKPCLITRGYSSWCSWSSLGRLRAERKDLPIQSQPHPLVLQYINILIQFHYMEVSLMVPPVLHRTPICFGIFHDFCSPLLGT